MFPDKLPAAEKYLYTEEMIFHYPLYLVHGFPRHHYSIDMHVQDFFEINIITKGSGMHYIEDRKLPVNQGDVFILPPMVPHGYVGGEDFDVYHFLISNRFMEKYKADLQILPAFVLLFNAEPLMRARDSEPLHLALSQEQFHTVTDLLGKIEALRNTHTANAAIVRNSLAMIFLSTLCDIYSQDAPEEICHDEAFMNALALIHRQYHEKITIDQLAQVAQLSRSAFLKRFGQICKTSPAKYLNRQRVEAAMSLLSGTNLSLSDIAEKTGFYDPSHFTKIFTAEVGETPGTYRKKHS